MASLMADLYARVSLFRSSRPDFIETPSEKLLGFLEIAIVPVFQAGLH